MRNLIYILSCLLLLTACDDGDVITVEIEFDDTFESCGDIVFYKTKSNPPESLSLQVTSPALTFEDLIEVEPIEDGSTIMQVSNPVTDVEINGVTNLFNYRTYNVDPSNFFCNDIPPANILITQDLSSAGGIALIMVELIEDDNDGVPAELEDINGNGDLTDDDTDGDGIPNYLDEDDDGDNVLTITELSDNDLVDANGDGDFDDDVDGNPLTNIVDTDGDGIPNYLDNDDDGDGVLTIDEENLIQDENPANDFTNPDVADYLNADVAETVPATAYREHTIYQEFEVSIEINDVSFPTITQEFFNFGTLENTNLSTERNITPDF